MARFYKCAHCGKVVGVIKDVGPDLICCGEKMEELGPKDNGEGEAKHVPVVKETDGLVLVKVGEVPHPMMEEHSIEWVYLLTDQGGQRKSLKPGMAPEVVFHIAPEEVVLGVYAYCNLHGLWAAKL